MKTAEQMAEKWAEHCGVVTQGHEENFLAALREHGAEVRARAAYVAREHEAQGVACSAAIERMKLP